MTDVASAQGPWSDDGIDVLDELVPPPRSHWRSAVVTAATSATIIAIAALGISGAVLPRLGAYDWRPAPSGLPGFDLTLYNNGFSSVQLRGLEVDAGGLGPAKASISSDNGHPLGPGVRLSAGRSVRVGVRFLSYDCSRIGEREPGRFAVRVGTAMGASVTVDVNISLPSQLSEGSAGPWATWPSLAAAASCQPAPRR